MNEPSYQDFKLGDRVWCLAWIGTRFEVVAKNDKHQVISIEAPSDSARYGKQIDIMPDTLWMLTREPWDQIWYWPDRAGERYDQVFDRFVSAHREGEIVGGYHLDGGLNGLFVRPEASRAMAFRIRALDQGARQIRVHPVAALADDGKSLSTDFTAKLAPERWMRSGPTLPLRIEMRMYRWCLSFGEVVLNWRDLLQTAANAG